MNQKTGRIISIIGFSLTLICVFFAFVYKDQIERYTTVGYLGLLISCMASTATVFLPGPGILIVLQYAQLLNPFIVVFLGGLGTSIGEILGYFLGKMGKEIINIKTDNKFLDNFNKKPYLSIFLFSVLPLPLFDVVGVASGMTKLNLFRFWRICFIGKTIKMSIYVVLFTYFKDILDFSIFLK